MAKMGRSSAVVRLISSSRERCGHTHQPADPGPLWVTQEELDGATGSPPTATWGVLEPWTRGPTSAMKVTWSVPAICCWKARISSRKAPSQSRAWASRGSPGG